jgi:hypothetical protein
MEGERAEIEKLFERCVMAGQEEELRQEIKKLLKPDDEEIFWGKVDGWTIEMMQLLEVGVRDLKEVEQPQEETERKLKEAAQELKEQEREKEEIEQLSRLFWRR